MQTLKTAALWMIPILLLLVAVWQSSAQLGESRAQLAAADEFEDADDEDDGDDEDDDGPLDFEPLERTVRLEFEFQSADGNEEPVKVVSAGGPFQVAVELVGESERGGMRIEGFVQRLDDAGNMLIMFDAAGEDEGSEGEAQLRAHGTARFAVGDERVIANFGEGRLVLRVHDAW